MDPQSENETTATVSSSPDATDCSSPEAAVSSPPDATDCSSPEATVSSPPDATDCSSPEATVSSPPDATDCSSPEATVSSTPDATDCSPPDATDCSSPEATISDTTVSSSNVARIFPEKVIANILTRLPVKSILRFNCVSEQWRTIASRKEFKTTHHIRSPSSLIIHTRHEPGPPGDDPCHHIYTCSPPNQPLLLNYPGIDDDTVETHMLIIGSTPDGVVCISEREYAEWVTLWNPDTGSYRLLPSPKLEHNPDIHRGASVGLGYDAFEENHIIVRIICHKDGLEVPDLVEVYSLLSGEWKVTESHKIGKIRVLESRCETVIDGIPYWRAVVNDVPVVASFDPEDLLFDKVPLGWDMSDDSRICIGEIRDCLGAVVWDDKECQYRSQVLDVWMLDEEKRWKKIHRVGALSFIGRVLGLYGERGIVQDIGGGYLYMFDDLEKFEDGQVVDVFPTLARFWTVTYKPSLFPIKEAGTGAS